MPWQAEPDCAKHHIAAIQHLVNSFLLAWLLLPWTGEIFGSKEERNRRLRAFALTEGFVYATEEVWVVIQLGDFGGSVTRNQRKLEARVEKDDKGKITSKRQRGHTNIHQLEYPWAALCSFKTVGKQRSGESLGTGHAV